MRVALPLDVTDHITSTESGQRRIENLVMRIEDVFLEDAELRLTANEVQRRCGVDETTCEAILETLVDATVLFKTGDCVYGRLIPHVNAA
jgi:hypothetical protein